MAFNRNNSPLDVGLAASRNGEAVAEADAGFAQLRRFTKHPADL